MRKNKQMLLVQDRSCPCCNKGFTLVEVAVAVTILGLALTILIGLQTRTLDAFRHEEQLTRAALYAKYIMTMYELKVERIKEGTDQDSLREVLRRTQYFGKGLSKEKADIEGWVVITESQKIRDEPILGKLTKLSLAVKWGDRDVDRYRLQYYLYN